MLEPREPNESCIFHQVHSEKETTMKTLGFKTWTFTFLLNTTRLLQATYSNLCKELITAETTKIGLITCNTFLEAGGTRKMGKRRPRHPTKILFVTIKVIFPFIITVKCAESMKMIIIKGLGGYLASPKLIQITELTIHQLSFHPASSWQFSVHWLNLLHLLHLFPQKCMSKSSRFVGGASF